MFRLSFEVLSPQRAAELEASLGKEYWPKLNANDKSKFDGEWYPVVRMSTEEESIRAQHANLEAWERDGTQPVRNVVLEEGEVQWSSSSEAGS